MDANPAYPLCHTVRSKCGQARATNRPDWSANQPWVVYVNGTAGLHFHSVNRAIAHLESKGFRFSKGALS